MSKWKKRMHGDHEEAMLVAGGATIFVHRHLHTDYKKWHVSCFSLGIERVELRSAGLADATREATDRVLETLEPIVKALRTVKP
jgi:phosphosulfolactate synthase (CoM biosynthesis protein A)